MSLTLEAYQAGTRTTAIYPKLRVEGAASGTPAYPCMGLAGELGELAVVLNKGKAGDGKGADELNTAKECGDILWYVAAIVTDLEGSLVGLFHPSEAILTFDDIDAYSAKESRPQALMGHLIIHTGIVCENVKKGWRDNGGTINAARFGAIKTSLGQILFAISLIIREYTRLSLSAVAQANLDKLRARAERGTLQGNGDAR